MNSLRTDCDQDSRVNGDMLHNKATSATQRPNTEALMTVHSLGSIAIVSCHCELMQQGNIHIEGTGMKARAQSRGAECHPAAAAQEWGCLCKRAGLTFLLKAELEGAGKLRKQITQIRRSDKEPHCNPIVPWRHC